MRHLWYTSNISNKFAAVFFKKVKALSDVFQFSPLTCMYRYSIKIIYQCMPYTEKPEKFMKYAGPPSFLCNNFTMFLISPLFESIMGMDSSTIYDMLPVSDRKDGVILDSSVTNIDMAKNYNDYPIEELQVPTLIFHAKDDKLASYTDTEKAVRRFPDCTFISFENGGHLMTGHGEEIKKAVSDFTEKH